MRWCVSFLRQAVVPVAGVLLGMLGVLPGASSSWAQQAPSPGPVHQQAMHAFHGADRHGKDGPLAKVGFDLAYLYEEYRAHRAAGAKRPFTSSQRGIPVRGGAVTIDATATHDAKALRAALEALGLQGGAQAGRMVSGRLPIEAIPDAAALADLRFARPARMLTMTGSVTSQGDTAMNAEGARQFYNVDGTGITIGAMSDTYDNFDDVDGPPSTTAADDIQSGDLPGSDNPDGNTTPVVVLDDSQEPGSDEGRAMLQIIHDVAPGAALAFHTASGGQANFANGIRDLRDAGADIIVDDVLYLAEPMFQDGVIAQAVDEVKNDGVAYFSAAGNLADQSYESDFRLEGTAHDFDGSGSVDTLQSIQIPKNTTVTFVLQWDDPFASAGGTGADTDLDFYAIDVDGDSIAASSIDPNIDSGDPVEIIDVENPTNSSKEYQLRIQHVRGPVPGRVKYVYNPGDVTYLGGDDYGDTGKPTLYGHANARGAEAVAAASYGGSREARPYTALGGVSILFDASGVRQQDDASRQKPGVAAPDCVNNTFFGVDDPSLGGTTLESDSDSDPNFCGTSAAAPHAAAVAALMLENRPGLSVDQVYGDLRGTADDIGAGGTDDLTGFGFIDASDAALPVELVAFDAVADERDVVLTWATATETNNAGFHIERRQGEGAFERVAFVPGAGTTTEPQTYRHRVADLPPGPHAFRLQQVDTDGTVHTSPVVEAVVGLDAAYELSPVYPNPAHTAAAIDLLVPTAQTVRVTVYDALGRRVRTLHDGPLAAYESVSITLPVETLPSGMYLIRVHGESFSAIRRATIVR